MSNLVQVTFHGLKSSESLSSAINQKAQRLRGTFPALRKMRATIECPHRKHTKNSDFKVRLETRYMGETIVVRSDADVRAGKTADSLIGGAFQVLKTKISRKEKNISRETLRRAA